MKKSALLLSFLMLSLSPLMATSAYFCDSNLERCSDLCGVFGGFEALYFTANQEGLEYARDDETHTLKYGWKLGGRGWYGYQGAGWDGVFVYDWVENRGSGDVENLLSALLIHPASEQYQALEAEAETYFNYQTLDILFGRSLSFCNNTVLIRPYFGARGMRLDQDLEVKYLGEDFDSSERVRWKSELRGAGLHAGMDTHFFFNRCLGIYGGFASSVLYGRSKSSHRQPNVNVQENQHTCTPGYHLKSGLAWHFRCPCYCDGFLKLGYEFSHWFNTPKIRRYTDGNHEGVSTSSSGGQFTLHGPTLSAELIF